MNRYCFQMQVAPAHIDEYRRRHAAVWPEMLAALAATGWQNYSLFLRPDGLLIGYVESDMSFDQLQERMATTDVNARWQADMASFFVDMAGTPDADLTLLTPVFHLADQYETRELSRSAADDADRTEGSRTSVSSPFDGLA